MTDRAGLGGPPTPGEDPRLADLAEACTRRLQAGEAIDPDADLAHIPDCAEALRGLLPTIRALVELGRRPARGRPAPPPPDRSDLQ